MKFKVIITSFLFFGVLATAYASVQAADIKPDYSDETFTFSLSGFSEHDYTNGRKKGSNSSMYINNISDVEFNVKPEVDSKKGTGTKYVQANKRGYFTAKPGKKYEVYNFAHENYWDGVHVRFHGHKDLWINTVKAKVKWSPDYIPESGVNVVGL